MTFQVPASKASVGQDRFEFTVGNETFWVRRAKFVNVDKLAGVEDDTAKALAFFKGGSEAQQKAVGALDRDQFLALVLAWREDSEVSEGEAEASES